MGPTTTMKLMAAKRPHLVPIYDTWVADMLLPADVGERWEWWGPWYRVFQGLDGSRLIKATESVRALAAEYVDVAHLSVLRILDIVIWQHAREARVAGGTERPT
jgi:hypothetical protein